MTDYSGEWSCLTHQGNFMKVKKLGFELSTIAALSMVSISAGTMPLLNRLVVSEQPQASLFSQLQAKTSLLQAEKEAQPHQVKIVQMSVLGNFSIILLIIGVSTGAAFVAKKGFVVIGEREVGIVIKKFSLNPSFKPPSNQLIALNGEAGCQADTLSIGEHWRFPWMYTVIKEPIVEVPVGEIALVIANDGEPIPHKRRLGKVVPCNEFQDARKFLENGGEKGQQLGILRTSKYRINTRLFTVITSANASEHGVKPQDLKVYAVNSDHVGIVTTLDGIEARDEEGIILGNKEHDYFQDAQKFIDLGGWKGLQEEVLETGEYNLNPWFVKVEQVPVTVISEGTVGVVVSLTGKEAPKPYVREISSQSDLAKDDFQLVEEGYRGIWKEPLGIGRHLINTKTKNIVLVPTNQITLDWSDDTDKADNNYDKRLGTLQLWSKDGFHLLIEIKQGFRVPGKNAPMMVAKIGSPGSLKEELTNQSLVSSDNKKFRSIRDLITRVLEPTVSNYFSNAVQDCEALDFVDKRSDRQREAKSCIESALKDVGVTAVDTLIGEINLPPQLQKILNDRKTVEEQKKTSEKEKDTERARQDVVRAKTEADRQQELVNAEINVEIAKKEADAERQRTDANSDRIIKEGQAQAEAYKAQINAFGGDIRSFVQYATSINATNNKVSIVPGVMVNNQNSSPNSVSMEEIVNMLHLADQANQKPLNGNSPLSQLPDPKPVETVEVKTIESSDHIICPNSNCKAENPPNHKYCSQCRAELVS
ncbi:flotillin family protein [Nostoc sp. CHAB 5844]|nr:flotillin family protein [Nostoc sp. CHAB 5844]